MTESSDESTVRNMWNDTMDSILEMTHMIESFMIYGFFGVDNLDGQRDCGRMI